MTIDLDELERLERETTPGPWEYDDQTGWLGSRFSSIPGVHANTGIGMVEIYGEDHTTGRFIAALRNAAPEIFKELRRLRGIVLDIDARGEVEVQSCCAYCGCNFYGPNNSQHDPDCAYRRAREYVAEMERGK